MVCYNYFLSICTYNHIRIVRHKDNLSIELFSSQIFDQFFKDCPIIKIILLIPLIFILPHLVSEPVFGVFLAEPVSDILAAAVTAFTFFTRFNKILDKGAGKV